MKLEKLSPNALAALLEKRLLELKKLLSETKQSCQHAPAGRIRISQKQGHPEYYLVKEKGSLRGRYLSYKKEALICQLAQKSYDQDLIETLQTEIDALQNYLRVTRNCTNIPRLYSSLCPSRRALTEPVILPDREYAARWQKVQYQGRPFTPEAPEYLTARGERVRSKSEVIIADALLRHGIPYRYEFQLKLNKGRQTLTFYPDFLCLNIRTRQEFLWEHFGMMDDPAYAQKATAKLRLYEENGILPGRNLLLTMETQTEPLSTRAVEKIISEFLSGES